MFGIQTKRDCLIDHLSTDSSNMPPAVTDLGRSGIKRLYTDEASSIFCQLKLLSKLDFVCNSSSTKDIQMLERIALDPATPPTILGELSNHPDSDFRAAVADNPNTPTTAIWHLAKDPDVNVRYQLAENHNIPLAVLQFLVEDEHPYVACRAVQTVSRLQTRAQNQP